MDGTNKCLGLVLILTFFMYLGMVSIPVKAQSVSNIIISPDGSLIGTTAIVQSGNIYTFTANITGNIQVQRSNIVIDGAGFAINGTSIIHETSIDLTNGVGQNPSNPTIQNVTIKNLIINGTVRTNGGGYNTFYNDYIMGGIHLSGSVYNNITICTVNYISMDYGADFNIITKNNLNGAIAFLISNETVDKNYWSDYLTKYPNATEIDSTGTGNQSYVYSIVETRIPLIYQDNHPLMKPVTIPLMGSNSLDTSTATPTVPELPNGTDKTEPFPTLPVLAIFVAVVAIVGAGLLVYFKKRIRGRST